MYYVIMCLTNPQPELPRPQNRLHHVTDDTRLYPHVTNYHAMHGLYRARVICQSRYLSLAFPGALGTGFVLRARQDSVLADELGDRAIGPFTGTVSPVKSPGVYVCETSTRFPTPFDRRVDGQAFNGSGSSLSPRILNLWFESIYWRDFLRE